MMRVKDTKTLPNGGFIFFQDRFKPPAMLSWGGTKLAIIAYRKDNALPRSTDVEVETDMHEQECSRRPELCYNTDKPLTSGTPERVVPRCRGCGGGAA